MNRTEAWITPEDVIEYTSIDCVRKRSFQKLRLDILRAQEYVISYTHNKFPDDMFPVIPENVKTALILLAEAYAKQAEDKANPKKVSEAWQDDYSYTLADSSEDDIVASLNIPSLLSDYVIPVSSGKISMDLFKL